MDAPINQLFVWGVLNCYVLENEQRIISTRGVESIITGDTKHANLGRLIAIIPNKINNLTTTPVTFIMPQGGLAHGYTTKYVTMVIKEYAAKRTGISF
jgi:hypothetical protein